MSRKERNTNLELLRIVSMVLIVMSHSDDWLGLAQKYTDTLCTGKLVTDWLDMGGQIGVGCFVLISGYFMVNQALSFKRILRLWGEVFFYTSGIFCISAVINIAQGTFSIGSQIGQILKSFFPVLFSQYWFVTAYIILMLLSPFLNKLIHAMDKSTYQLFLFILITVFFVIDGGLPLVLPGMAEGRLMPVFGMYFIAGYIRLHVDNRKQNFKKHLTVAIVGYALLYLSFIGITFVGTVLHSRRILSMYSFFRPLNSPLVLIINVELFLAFLRLNVKQSRAINTVASCSFGVYLIHSNPIVSTGLLPIAFPVYKVGNPLLIFVYSVAAVAVVYAVCVAIDLIRLKTVEKIWMRYLNGRYETHKEGFKKSVYKINRFLSKALDRYYG